MEYRLKVAQDDVHVEVDIGEDRNLKISVDQKSYAVRYTVVPDHWIHMAVNSNGHIRQVNACVSDGPEGKTVAINGRTYLVCDTEARAKRSKKTTGPALPEQITPPMPAVVVRIPVQPGDRVEKGQGVIVVSAMKMETTLCAPFNGIVVKINVAIHDKVAPGQILVEIEKEGDN